MSNAPPDAAHDERRDEDDATLESLRAIHRALEQANQELRQQLARSHERFAGRPYVRYGAALSGAAFAGLRRLAAAAHALRARLARR